MRALPLPALLLAVATTLTAACHKPPARDAAEVVPDALPALQAVLSAKDEAVNDCFQPKALQGILPEGTLSLRWTVDGHGQVTDVATKADSMHSAAVAQCLQKLLRGLHYPEHGTTEPVALSQDFSAP